MFAIGFDIGGTKIEAALVRFTRFTQHEKLEPDVAQAVFPFETKDGRMLAGAILARERVPTERHKGYDQIVEKMATLVRTICEKAAVEVDSVAGLGLAIPGSVDPRTLRMANGNTLVLKDRDLAGDLRVLLQAPALRVAAENDANCFALAETLCGAGVAHARDAGLRVRDLVCVGLILGTGCGGGIVVQGETLKGRRGGGGEIGHVTFRAGGKSCWCGKRGCAEQYLAGSALEQTFNGRLYSQSPKVLSSREIFAFAADRDPVALACVNEYRADLAMFLSDLSALFDPDLFVLGGGVSLQDAVYENLEMECERLSFLPGVRVPVKRNVLGDSAGVVGAALLVVKDM